MSATAVATSGAEPVRPAAGPDEAEAAALQRAAIDRSCRAPVLWFYGSAVIWLLIGTALALLASFKLHTPDFAAGPGWPGWLTFGRVRPAHLNTVIFGWAAQAGLGTLLWLMCRLCRVPLRRPALPLAAAVLWNIGVTVGTIGILAGHGTSIEWLEFPTYAAFFLFAAFAVVSLWALLTFADRQERHVYVSQWYLFAAVFWFPWLYSTVQILLLLAPVKGVVQASTNWWFAHNVLGLFFTPIGLAAVYYLIPKVIGRPIHSYYLSILGFWTLALFYNWAGGHHLIGGPVPAWLVTASTVGSMMMFIPVTAVAINHHLTMRRHFGMLRYSPTLRFTVYGAMSYTVVSVQGSLMALRAYNEPTHFTHHTIGHAHLGMYGFFTMVMFGALYYIVPRLTGREWASPKLISVHFWGTALGMALMFLSLSLGGAIQGLEMNNAAEPWNKLVVEHGWVSGTWRFLEGCQARSGTVPFMDIVAGSIPWLWVRSASGVLITVGHLAFALLALMNISGIGPRRTGPALFRDDPAGYRGLIAEEASR
jgi:cytochrome c oxidase cbb3-type subunit 1